MKKPILLQIYSHSSCELIFYLAEKFHSKGESILFFVENADENLRKNVISQAKKLKANIIFFDDIVKIFDLTKSEIKKNMFAYFLLYPVLNINKKLIFKTKVKMLDIKYRINEDYPVELKPHIIYHKCMLEATKIYLELFSPKLIIVLDDGLTGNAWLLSVGKAKKIPIIDCPYGYCPKINLENDLERKAIHGELFMCEGELGKIINEKYPQWVKNGKHSGAIMFKPEYILAREYMNLSIKNPWILHGGYSDILIVESEAMMDHYLNEIGDEQRLAFVGTVYADILYNALSSNNDYMASYIYSKKIYKNKTKVLINWPPNYDSERGECCEFDSYEILTKNVFEALYSIPNVEITISLHPAMLENDRKLFEKYSVDICKDPITGLIPKHDIYISCYSSTIRWAIALGKPVINYDIYKFMLTDYRDSNEIITIMTFSKFQDVYNRLVLDENYYNEIARSSKKWREKWAIMDGKNFERIYNLVNKLTSNG